MYDISALMFANFNIYVQNKFISIKIKCFLVYCNNYVK